MDFAATEHASIKGNDVADKLVVAVRHGGARTTLLNHSSAGTLLVRGMLRFRHRSVQVAMRAFLPLVTRTSVLRRESYRSTIVASGAMFSLAPTLGKIPRQEDSFSP